MELPATVFVAVGAIIASLITGIITFTNILISKDQKRQSSDKTGLTV